MAVYSDGHTKPTNWELRVSNCWSRCYIQLPLGFTGLRNLRCGALCKSTRRCTMSFLLLRKHFLLHDRRITFAWLVCALFAVSWVDYKIRCLGWLPYLAMHCHLCARFVITPYGLCLLIGSYRTPKLQWFQHGRCANFWGGNSTNDIQYVTLKICAIIKQTYICFRARTALFLRADELYKNEVTANINFQAWVPSWTVVMLCTENLDNKPSVRPVCMNSLLITSWEWQIHVAWWELEGALLEIMSPFAVKLDMHSYCTKYYFPWLYFLEVPM
jgi:hypothetical protein